MPSTQAQHLTTIPRVHQLINQVRDPILNTGERAPMHLDPRAAMLMGMENGQRTLAVVEFWLEAGIPRRKSLTAPTRRTAKLQQAQKYDTFTCKP